MVEHEARRRLVHDCCTSTSCCCLTLLRTRKSLGTYQLVCLCSGTSLPELSSNGASTKPCLRLMPQRQLSLMNSRRFSSNYLLVSPHTDKTKHVKKPEPCRVQHAGAISASHEFVLPACFSLQHATSCCAQLCSLIPPQVLELVFFERCTA